MPFMDKPHPGGFLPDWDTRDPDPNHGLNPIDVWINSLPDWHIFQSETYGALFVTVLLVWWLRRYAQWDRLR